MFKAFGIRGLRFFLFFVLVAACFAIVLTW
jgi:hypothetical protein